MGGAWHTWKVATDWVDWVAVALDIGRLEASYFRLNVA